MNLRAALRNPWIRRGIVIPHAGARTADEVAARLEELHASLAVEVA